MKKQIWIPETKKIPSIRNVLFEKTTIDKEGFCLFVNGIPIISIYDSQLYHLYDGRKMAASKSNYNKYLNVTDSILVNMPLETICKDSKILWRLSKYSFRARIYLDSVNDKFVINKL